MKDKEEAEENKYNNSGGTEQNGVQLSQMIGLILKTYKNYPKFEVLEQGSTIAPYIYPDVIYK